MSPSLETRLRLDAKTLRWHCDPNALGISSTSGVPPCEEIIGQERALRAIQTGLGIKSHGYNIYVAGLTGTGKTTTIEKLLMQMDRGTTAPPDICYVNNFNDPDAPRCLTFSAGQGRAFAKAMDQMVRSLRKHLPAAFKRDAYKQRRKALIEELRRKVAQEVQAFEKTIQEKGMALVQVQSESATRPEIFPVIGGEVTPWNKVKELLDAGQIKKSDLKILQKQHDEYMEALEVIASHHQELEKETHDALVELDQNTARPTVNAQIKRIAGRFTDAKVAEYLAEVGEDILFNLEHFQGGDEEEQVQNGDLPLAEPGPEGPFLPYRVNVVVDNAKTQGHPIVIEKAPSFHNLFGAIEKVWDPSGIWRTDFTKIKAGSLLRANGGYLVFNLLDAGESGVWPTLKRTLKNKQLLIQSPDSQMGFSGRSLKPEPVDIDLKVVVIGDEHTYRALYEMDDEFKKIFKIRADFDTVMPNDDAALKQYLSFAAKIVKDEGLLHLDKAGMAAVLEHGVWLAGRQNRLTTRFSDVADIIREAHYWAAQEGSKLIKAAHVDKALAERVYRVNLVEDKIQEMIDEGTLMLQVEGRRVGQVNGLSVLSLGDYAFGRPTKITAETAVGQAGIINIEREAELSGPSHNKGVLILAGYLRRLYAQDKPLAVAASLCFEQSYSGVDGDSASSTEIYALLSALSDVPLRQDIAVTGSVNQKGEIQAIGGVNHKIEGFYDVCKAKGITGTQGVLIPHTNVGDLMLRADVVAAVAKKRFHIWAVETIDQGIEILTGIEAGKREADGRFTPGSIHQRADARLETYAQCLRGYLGQGSWQ